MRYTVHVCICMDSSGSIQRPTMSTLLLADQVFDLELRMLPWPRPNLLLLWLEVRLHSFTLTSDVEV